MGKFQKYIDYLISFGKSSEKKVLIKGLLNETTEKGLVMGFQSFIHKRVYNYSNDVYLNDEVAFTGTEFLSIKRYNQKASISLPKVASPKVSVIIPTYNQLEHTFNCISSIYENSKFRDYEIIIADDNSSKGTHLLEKSFENLVVLKNKTNLGFLKNCNNAASHARGEYIVFLNNDTQIQSGWLEELLFVFENFKQAGIAGSKLVYPNGRLQEAGGILWQDGSAMNYGNGDNPDKEEYNYIKEADYVSGASIMIKKELWEEIGGFDEQYSPAYCEDSDLCMEVRKRGYKVIYQPFSVVVHFEGVSHGTDLEKGVKQYQIINQKNFYDKWHKELQKKSKKNEHIFCERDRTQGKKHVLLIDHYLPQIDKDAGSRTISNFMDVLLGLDYSVKFLGENQNPKPDYTKYFQHKGIEVLYGKNFNFATNGWANYLKANMDKLDAVILSRSSVCLPIISFLTRNKYKGNIIYYGHDLGFRRIEKEAEITGDKLLLKEARRIKAEEDFMYQLADNALGISTEEMEYLRKYIKTPLHYIPPYFFEITHNTAAYEERSGIFFIGGFNHTPNRDAMKWFLEEVYAQLDSQGIPFTIAGSYIPEFIFEYKKRFKLLTVLPDVPVEELNNLYAQIRIAIVPLTNGAGVKGKVIEAMAKGVPVVGTDIAFEGMPKDAAFLYKGYNTAGELADNIIYTYTNKEHWQKLSTFGKDYVLNNFNKENMKQVFKNLIG